MPQNSYPPEINSIIIINRGNLQLIGEVIMLVPDNKDRYLVRLINNRDYYDKTLSRYNISKKGYVILLDTDVWKPYDISADITPKTIYDDKIVINIPKMTQPIDEDEYCIHDRECPNVQPLDNISIGRELKRGIPKEMVGIPTSKIITYDNPIAVHQDELGEGFKIISWLTTNLKKLGIKMDMTTHNGYVHILREGCGGTSIVTEELLSNRKLRFFEWQIGKPINYSILRNILFRNNFQKHVEKDMAQLDEAKLILSLEYLISLQPAPKFQLWCVYRLIIYWLSDQEMLENVRKIKLLINTYRSRPEIKENRVRGILPSIVVYPNYGADSAKVVLKKINYAFTFFKNVAWIKSSPTYFIKVDELLYYTNGLSDLKLYVRNVVNESNFSNDNLVFDDKYTTIDLAENLFTVIE